MCVLALVGLAVLPLAGSTPAGPQQHARTSQELRAVAVPMGAVAFGAASIGIVEFVLPLDLDRSYGSTAATIGVLFAIAAALNAVASPLAGAAGDKHGRVVGGQNGNGPGRIVCRRADSRPDSCRPGYRTPKEVRKTWEDAQSAERLRNRAA